MVAPNTAIKMSKSPSPVKESKKPIMPGMIMAQYGALFSLVSDKFFGKYPARDNAKIWREYA